MESKKTNIQHVARKLIRHFRFLEKKSTSAEIDELWKQIELRAITERRKSNRRTLYIIATSAAAVLLCLVWIGNHFFYNPEDSAIAEFALQTQASQSENEDILLLMPGEKKIEVETNADIIYSQDGALSINSDTVVVDQVKVQEKKTEYNQLVIPKGKRSQLTLSDGSRLWVNSGTRVVYPRQFGKKMREIYVEGEVYLEVFHNEKAPFVVKTKDFQVQVLGTTFNVSAYLSEQKASVVLVEGSVNIKNQQKEQVKMTPGQLVNIRTGQLDKPKDVDIEPYVCWVKNMLMYSDEPLSRVFNKLNLYYGKEFVLDSGIEKLLVSGKLDLKENLEDVLHTISYSVPISYEEIDSKIYVRKIDQ